MDGEEIAAEIRQFMLRESNLADASLLSDEMDLFDNGILDSLMVVSLISFCEERFGCWLNGQEFSEQDLRTIGSLAAFLAGAQTQGR